MKPVTYMIPEDLDRAVERRSGEANVTQDEIVRRALAEYLAKEKREAMSEYVPRDIKTRLVRPDH